MGRPAYSPALVPSPSTHRYRFPTWGWFGLGFGAVTWVLAWSRFPWFSSLQSYTFTPLWLSFIIVINALTVRRKGSCLIIKQTALFLALFPASALFWWTFEYFNRFVRNWYYLEVDRVSAFEYGIHASICFSTVLPAVYSVYASLSSFPGLQRIFSHGPPLRLRYKAEMAFLLLPASAASFFFIGLYPHILYPLLWSGSLLTWIALNYLARTPIDFGGIENGDWRYLFTWALAALFCGFFWEMWNFYSHAKWVYSVPYFQAFHIFEMPLLGYTGYLPFGLECACVIQVFYGRETSRVQFSEFRKE